MPLQYRRSKKDGRKRAYSVVSSDAGAHPESVPSPTPVETSLPPQQPNRSRQTLKSPPIPENPPQKPGEPEMTMPNVFQFLEEDNGLSSGVSSGSESLSESDEELERRRHMRATTRVQYPKPRVNTVPQGVLVSGGNAPPRKATRPPPVAPKAPTEPRKQTAAPTPAAWYQMVSQKKQPTTKPSPISTASPPSGNAQVTVSRPQPQSHHGSSRDIATVHRPPLPPSPPRSPEEITHHPAPTKRREPSPSPQVESGYGLLAAHLTNSASEESGGFAPLYRRFETINHRVLLHLQDEISQMEEDLHALDDYEEMHRVNTAEQEGTKPLLASRRRDAQSQAYSSLHYRRMDLMGILIQKTEQYNNALSAYSKVLQTLPRASDQDVTNYRNWMREHRPVAGIETRFLIYNADLVSLTPRRAVPESAVPVYISIILASAAILLPMLAFSPITGFSTRIIIVTVVGGGAAAIAAKFSIGAEILVDPKDGWCCAGIYFGFMGLAAMLIP
ncbi:hypothetical protein N7457_000206 [Penicillium paradoxum]|uniref:uncharacterized protein n=1 Tax=Penicillium paradoxum TaxID=176176 RepID=UPI0025485920|nr:uncharacterized protein N7457_000206 [Penicillium paradoxum]KAJ5793607.1 hypothetical protein N7457_000206 [Penicillium paradoxum]